MWMKKLKTNDCYSLVFLRNISNKFVLIKSVSIKIEKQSAVSQFSMLIAEIQSNWNITDGNIICLLLMIFRRHWHITFLSSCFYCRLFGFCCYSLAGFLSSFPVPARETVSGSLSFFGSPGWFSTSDLLLTSDSLSTSGLLLTSGWITFASVGCSTSFSSLFSLLSDFDDGGLSFGGTMEVSFLPIT